MVEHLKQNLTQLQTSVEGPGEGVLEASLACGTAGRGSQGSDRGLQGGVGGAGRQLGR